MRSFYRQVKFWDFEVANGNLGMVHTRSLKVTDDVLCVRYSRHKQQTKLLVAGGGWMCRIPLVFGWVLDERMYDIFFFPSALRCPLSVIYPVSSRH